jgi:hypothetical protein
MYRYSIPTTKRALSVHSPDKIVSVLLHPLLLEFGAGFVEFGYARLS